MRKKQIITLALSRYKMGKDPLRQALGLHQTTPISLSMASKMLTHSDPRVAKAAAKIVGKGPKGPMSHPLGNY